MSWGAGRARVDGFTMIEAIAAVAVTAAIVMALSAVVGQWLPNWSHGFAKLQRADLLSTALERISEDLSAAEFVTPSSDVHAPLFDGDASSVTLVRSATGPNAFPHLEVVRFAATNADGGIALSRMSAAFAPGVAGGRSAAFANAVPLVRAPLRVVFSYAGPDRVWADSWKGRPDLPEAVRVSVRDTSADGALAASTAVRVKVTAQGAPKQEGGAAGAESPTAQAQASAAAPAAATSAWQR
jgi:general secretion pathway protein J